MKAEPIQRSRSLVNEPPIRKKLVTLVTATLTALSLLLITTTPANAVTKPTPSYTQITVTGGEARELIKELEQAGFTKTAIGNSQTETITLTKAKLTITLARTTDTSPIQSRNDTDRWVVGILGLFYGTDAWGFYIKMEWNVQASLFLATLIPPFGLVAAGTAVASRVILQPLIKALMPYIISAGVSLSGAALTASLMDQLKLVDTLIDVLTLCPPFQPRYIRFDPFRTKCN